MSKGRRGGRKRIGTQRTAQGRAADLRKRKDQLERKLGSARSYKDKITAEIRRRQDEHALDHHELIDWVGDSARLISSWDPDDTLYIPMVPIKLNAVSLCMIANAAAIEHLPESFDFETASPEFHPDPKSHHHWILNAWRKQAPGGRTYTLVRVETATYGTGLDSFKEMFLSITDAHWGVLNGDRLAREEALTLSDSFLAQIPLRIIEPKWEIARAFKRTWKSLDRLVFDNKDGARDMLAEDGKGDQNWLFFNRAIDSLQQMTEAHLIAVDPQQVNVLPQLDLDESIDYLRSEPTLPFDTVYFDFEGPGMVYPFTRAAIQIMENNGTPSAKQMPSLREMAGALVWTGGSTTLHIAPVMPHYWPQLLSAQATRVSAVPHLDYAPVSIFVFDGVVHDEEPWIQSYRSKVLGSQLSQWCVGLQEFYNRIEELAGTEGVKVVKEKDGPGIVGGKGGTIPQNMTGYCMTFLTRKYTGELPSLGDGFPVHAQHFFVANAVNAVSRVLDVLYFLDSSNVELVEAPVSRQVRRRSDREGRPIGTVVEIRTSKRKYIARDGGEGDGMPVEFSHRFEVSSHYKHFPVGTRMADSRPDLVKYCSKCDAPCRKIWTPSFVKGPEDKPFIPKTRHVKYRSAA